MTAPVNRNAISCVLAGDESLTIGCGDIVLAGGHRIVAVVTTDADVRRWAEGRDLLVLPRAVDLVTADIGKFDWLLSVANLKILSDAVLALPVRGAVNFHDGPLPRYAGLNTPAWAIIHGEAQHGVSWHMLEGGVDEGDLLGQVMIDIAPDETAFSLNSKCYAAGMESFGHVLAQLESGALEPVPQDLSRRSYFARDDRPAGFCRIDFSRSANEICALLRGLDFGGYANPLGLAKIEVAGRVLAVASGEPVDQAGVPGVVIAAGEDDLIVGTGDSAVRLRGFTDLGGGTVTLPSAGTVLPSVDPMIDDAQAQAVGEEPHWRATLSQVDPVEIAFDVGDPSAQIERVVDLPKGLERARVAQAVGLMALQSAGMAKGYIAVAITPKAKGYIRDWVPLEIDAGAPERFVESFEKTLHSKGFAADLYLREPKIRDVHPTAIISSGKPLDGPYLSVGLEEDRVTLRAPFGDLAMDLLARRLEAALEHVDADEAGPLSLPADERRMVLHDWNDTAVSYDSTQTLHAAFEAQVARTPDLVALVFEDRQLSYTALNAAANQLAHVLRAQGVRPGAPVGLCVARGPDLLIGALGILKAGGAYVPLDPAYPKDRIAHYIADSGARIIVTQAALADDLPGGAQTLLLNDPAIAAASEYNPPPAAGKDDLAYLIYTSGSTGTPKGVMVAHRNVANFFTGMDARIDHRQGDVWLAVTSLSFDISVLELFWTLARGFKLVLAGDDSRTELSRGPIALSDRKIDFNLFYWGNDDGVGPKKYELLLEGAKFADAHGFNAVWTPERHFHAFGGPYPNPSVTGAAVAAVTRNLDVRAGSCVAPLHHPARIAEEWAVIDNMTGGRVGLAIASGWQPDDFVLRPENTPPANKPAMYAAIDQLRSLWRGDAVEFPTKDGTAFAVVTQPRPVTSELPIWVTTAGNPDTWREAGEIGANVLTHLLGQSIDEVADKIGIYHQALRGAGQDPANFKVTVMLHTYLAGTRAEAERVAREPMKDYLRSAAGLIKQYAWAFPAFKKPKGVTNPFEVDLGSLDAAEMEAILDFAFERYFNDSGLFGTVEDGLARAEQLKRIGVDEIACLIDYGIAPAVVLEGLKPLARVLARANAGTVLAEDDFSLAAQMVRHKVSHLQCTPSMARMLVTNDETRQVLRGLRALMVGGEALPGTLAASLTKAAGVPVQNMYGPTETTIWSTTFMTQGDDVTVPIGNPIANTQVYVLDGTMDPCAVGVEGEIYIAGDGVTQGYWKRDAMTKERFVPDPFGQGLMYRTGDLAAWRADGILRFRGRADDQVKIRGHRIELGEIEAALAAQNGVQAAVVIARETPGGAQLVGYVTGDGIATEETLKAALTVTLPQIMVPSRIVKIDAMPLTPNKKIDRKALPAPEVQADAEPCGKAPADATQRAIADVWQRILGVANVRASDNFFALGGHSLLAVQAHRDIRQALGTDRLSITDIFRFPTLDALAAHLGGVEAPQPDAAVAPSPERTETMSKRRAMRASRSKAGV